MPRDEAANRVPASTDRIAVSIAGSSPTPRDPPGAPWSLDDEMRVKLGTPVRLVYRRLDPDAYMAFGARDYETRNPRAS